jgi:hypothetical protein
VPDSIKTILQNHDVLKHVILPIELDMLLSLLEPAASDRTARPCHSGRSNPRPS